MGRRQRLQTGAAALLALGWGSAGAVAEAGGAGMDRRELFELLTRTSWCDRVREGEPRPLFGDFTDWELRADGSYRWEHFTDYVPSPSGSGQWTLEQAHGEWVAQLSNGERHLVSVDGDGYLILGRMRYRPCRSLPAAPADAAASLPPVRLPDHVFTIIGGLTCGEWHRTNDLDLNMRPTSVRFERDWSYVSVYRDGECQNRGTWYATATEVQAWAAANPCNLRNPRYSESMLAVLHRDGRLVFPDGEPYLRKEKLDSGRGILWLLSGRQELEAWVEYDRPIRRGRANHLTLHVRHQYWQPRHSLHLRRFAVNVDYVREYRDAAGRVEPAPSEVAGADLAGVVVNAGEERSLSFDVRFSQALQQWLYFDLIMDLDGEAMDLRRSHFVRIRE